MSHPGHRIDALGNHRVVSQDGLMDGPCPGCEYEGHLAHLEAEHEEMLAEHDRTGEWPLKLGPVVTAEVRRGIRLYELERDGLTDVPF